MYSREAALTLSEIEPLLKPKYGECAGVFVPADVVIEVGSETQNAQGGTASRHPILSQLSHLSYIGMFGVAAPVRSAPEEVPKNLAHTKFIYKMIKKAQQSRGITAKRKH